MGASLAAGLGLPDLVARTPGDYVEVAVQAARPRGRARRLGRLKMRLRRAVRIGTLFNADAWVYWYEVCHESVPLHRLRCIPREAASPPAPAPA
jgi:predicted O-linked N-acetylglucosamine transferase (SPINDLY family)